jgi:hypothetical protein
MKTRPEYVAICQTCLKSKFNSKKGLICSLTDKHAAFETEDCPDYEVQESAVRRQEAAARRKVEEMEDKKGIFSGNAGTIGGAILILLAIVWVTVGLVLMDRIFFYPIVLVLGGVISINKGIAKKKLQTRREQSTVLDDNLDEII